MRPRQSEARAAITRQPRKPEAVMLNASRPDLKETLMPLMVTESGRDDGWMAAVMDAAGIDEAERVGIWVGGLAMPFGEVYSPPKATWGEKFLSEAFDETLGDAEKGETSISFCADHSCAVSTGLIGRTAQKTGEAQATFWVERKDGDLGPAGMYVIGRVAEFAGSPSVVIAEQVERGAVDGISVSGWALEENRLLDDDDYSDFYEVKRFKLYETSIVAGPAYKDTFVKSGRFGDMEEDKRTEKAETAYRSLAQDELDAINAENRDYFRSVSENLTKGTDSEPSKTPMLDLSKAELEASRADHSSLYYKLNEMLASPPVERGFYREYRGCDCQTAAADKPEPKGWSAEDLLRAEVGSLRADVSQLTSRLDEISASLGGVGAHHMAKFAAINEVPMPAEIPEVKSKSFIPFPV